MTQGERIAALEVELREVRSAMNDMKTTMREVLVEVKGLTALRNRGAGVFWLMSALSGTGVIAIVMGLLDWIRLR